MRSRIVVKAAYIFWSQAVKISGLMHPGFWFFIFCIILLINCAVFFGNKSPTNFLPQESKADLAANAIHNKLGNRYIFVYFQESSPLGGNTTEDVVTKLKRFVSSHLPFVAEMYRICSKELSDQDTKQSSDTEPSGITESPLFPFITLATIVKIVIPIIACIVGVLTAIFSCIGTTLTLLFTWIELHRKRAEKIELDCKIALARKEIEIKSIELERARDELKKSRSRIIY